MGEWVGSIRARRKTVSIAGKWNFPTARACNLKVISRSKINTFSLTRRNFVEMGLTRTYLGKVYLIYWEE